jgi:hypothetical protein
MSDDQTENDQCSLFLIPFIGLCVMITYDLSIYLRDFFADRRVAVVPVYVFTLRAAIGSKALPADYGFTSGAILSHAYAIAKLVHLGKVFRTCKAD